MKRDNEFVYNKNNIEEDHPEFYKVNFGHYINICYDPNRMGYFHPMICRYLNINDIKKSKEFLNILNQYDDEVRGKKIMTTLSPNDNLIFSNGSIFVPTFLNAKDLTHNIKLKALCEKMLKLAKKHKIWFYTKKEMIKTENNQL